MYVSNPARATLISRWNSQYTFLLRKEDEYRQNKKTYLQFDRGSVVKVEFGFNIGSELGGLHYAIVLNKTDSIKSPVLFVVPLSSKKEEKPLGHYHIDLGDHLHKVIKKKSTDTVAWIATELDKNIAFIKKNTKAMAGDTSHLTQDEEEKFNDEIKELTEVGIPNLTERARIAQKVLLEIKKMKSGSIAQIGQITTISKLRIVNPLSSNDVLFGIKVSPETLDLIDNALRRTYLGPLPQPKI